MKSKLHFCFHVIRVICVILLVFVVHVIRVICVILDIRVASFVSCFSYVSFMSYVSYESFLFSRHLNRRREGINSTREYDSLSSLLCPLVSSSLIWSDCLILSCNLSIYLSHFVSLSHLVLL